MESKQLYFLDFLAGRVVGWVCQSDVFTGGCDSEPQSVERARSRSCTILAAAALRLARLRIPVVQRWPLELVAGVQTSPSPPLCLQSGFLLCQFMFVVTFLP